MYFIKKKSLQFIQMRYKQIIIKSTPYKLNPVLCLYSMCRGYLQITHFKVMGDS